MFRQPDQYQMGHQPLPIDNADYNYELGSLQSILPEQFNHESSSSNQQLNDSQGSQYFEQLKSMISNSGTFNTQYGDFQMPNQRSIGDNQICINQKPFFSPNHSIEFQQSLLSRLHNKVSYDDIANQAQQLLDKLSASMPPSNCNPLNQIRNSVNLSSSQYVPHQSYSHSNSFASQSSPPKRLQLYLNNFSQNSPSNGTLKQNEFRAKNPLQISSPRNSEIITNRTLSNQNLNASGRQVLMNNVNQRQNNPRLQSTFPPDMPELEYNPNMRRLDTASELIYPNRHVEYLPHSY